MKVKASTILSFYTGRLYSRTAPTVLFGPMLEYATGRRSVFTHELSDLRQSHGRKILEQCPVEFQTICKSWQHGEDWEERVNLIDTQFGEIEIQKCS